MSVVKDLLTSPDVVNTSNSGRLVSAISGIAIIGLALMDKKSSSLSKWIKIGSGAVLILRAAAGYQPVNRALGFNKAASVNG